MSNSASREILVSTGYINNYTLPQPNSLGVQSHVTPGVVCSSGKARGYFDCMVAYVRQDDTNGEIRIRRFSAFIPTGATRYSLDIDPVESLAGPNFRTASAIAAWYHNGKFFVAARPLRTITPNEQNIEIVTSSDTVNWTLLKGGNEIGYSAVGPSAVSYWNGTNNVLGYWR